MSVISSFVKDLPSYNVENFSLFNSETGIRTSMKRPSVYLRTVDSPAEQTIVSDQQNILLRFLHHQYERKAAQKRREQNAENSDANRKRPRLDGRLETTL